MDFNKPKRESDKGNVCLYLSKTVTIWLHDLAKLNGESMNKTVEDMVEKEAKKKGLI